MGILQESKKWIKDKWLRFKKWFLVVVFGIGVASAAQFAGNQIQTQDEVYNLIHQFEEQYYQENGEYMQVLRGGNKPSDVKKFNKKLFKQIKKADNYRVDVYDGPEGKGYKIIYEDDKTIKERDFNKKNNRVKIKIRNKITNNNNATSTQNN